MIKLYHRRKRKMILEIGFNDYRMFRNWQCLTFKADKRTKYLSANFISKDNVGVLKSLALYGPNNSGKSNLIYLIDAIKQILQGGTAINCNRDIFKDKNEFSSYITYFNDDKDGSGWITYEFTYDNIKKQFTKEKLSRVTYYKKGQNFRSNIFVKDLYNKELNIFGVNKSELIDILPSDKPFLYTISLQGEFSNLKRWRNSLFRCSEDIVILKMFNIPIKKTIEMLKGNNKKKIDFINSFVRSADLSVKEFQYTRTLNPQDTSNENIDESVLNDYADSLDSMHLITTYEDTSVPSIFFDSTGTKKVEAIASYIYECINQGKLLVVDELDNGLHFTIARAIIGMINNIANQKGQILFTTHDLMLIDCNNLLRKDQIYFINRTKDGSTLFSLKTLTANDNGLREGSGFVKRYNHGDFGGIPMPDFTKELLEASKN